MRFIDDQTFFLSDSDGFFRKYSFSESTFTPESETMGHYEAIKCLDIIPEKGLLFTGCRDSTGKLWSLDKLEYKATLLGPSDQAVCVDYSPEKDLLAIGAWDSKIWLYNLSTLPRETSWDHLKPRLR